MSKLEQRRRTNPSSILYWGDLRDDAKLRRCSPGAKGVWAVHMLPAAAESPEYGVVILDGLPSLHKDLGGLFAREVGETPEATQALVDELVTKGAASIDDKGRVYCRRMVREERLRLQRSNAGKLGAAAKWQTDGEPYGEKHGERSGEGNGKIDAGQQSNNPSGPALNGSAPENGGWQTDGEGAGKPLASSLSSRPSRSLSLERDSSPSGDLSTDDGGIDRATVDAGFAAWNTAAARFGWPIPRKVDADRIAKMRARLRDYGPDGLRDAIEAAAASDFVRDQMGFNLDWLLKPANWRKLIEGNYVNGRRKRPAAERGRADTLRDVTDALRQHEQRPEWQGVEI